MRSVEEGAATRFELEAKIVQGWTVWPNWADRVLLDLLGPFMRSESWPGTQYILQALADAYADQENSGLESR